MHNINPVEDTKTYYINEISINSRETLDIFHKINGTFLNVSYDLFQSLELHKVLGIRNPKFELEFNEKSRELEETSSLPDHYEVRYGFLATLKGKMIDKVACEGLEVQMCPYNYLGYNVAGVHISQNADVCLNEAKNKINPGDELILILFQFMLGRRKFVAMHDPKTLLAPTPNFDSHICEERPDLKEKESFQYIKSLVYLYEFANGNLDPVIRPRHCCPIAALIFKNIPSYQSLYMNGSEPITNFSTSYQSPLSLLKPVSHHVQPNIWERQFSRSEIKQSSIIVHINDEDTRKIIVAPVEKDLYNIENTTSTDEILRSVSPGDRKEGSRDLLNNLSNGINKYTDLMCEPVGREKNTGRNRKWKKCVSQGVVKSGKIIENSNRNSVRGSKNWFN